MLIRRNGSPSGTSGPLIPGAAAIGAVHVLAPAKINLYLEILGKRPDGYHEIETLILAVELYDEITLRPDAPGALSLTCDVPELATGSDNLVLKAARLLKEQTGSTQGAAIHLEKRIPWAAGLGGGSSDAAATLAGLNELWALGLSAERLSAMGAEIGSDVPFFFHTPAALCRGRGEVVEPAKTTTAFEIVLVKPEAGLSTAEVYREFGAERPSAIRNPQSAVTALADGNVENLGRALHNRLQEPALRACPPAATLYRQLQAAATAGCLLSGSGSCLFALCRDTREAARVIDGLRRGWASGDELESTRVFHVRSCLN
jgi:4-diphosphocytidyl-2-C-methyl-D-erythritol kinase